MLHSFIHLALELNKLAADNRLELRQLPTVYEVRWTEFSYAPAEFCLGVMEGFGFYLKQSPDVTAMGAHLISFSNLQLLVFLADVLIVYERFQKRLQSDSTTLIDMHDAVINVKSTLNAMKSQPLTGGWQKTWPQSVTDVAANMFMKDIRLSVAVARH